MNREEANARLAQIKQEYDSLIKEVVALCNEHELSFSMRSSGKTFYATEDSFKEYYIGLDRDDDEEWNNVDIDRDYYLSFPAWVGSSDIC